MDAPRHIWEAPHGQIMAISAQTPLLRTIWKSSSSRDGAEAMVQEAGGGKSMSEERSLRAHHMKIESNCL